jgi:O-acetyl-ADP-ribose deacetylase (regulator of RNase III)
VGPVWRGGKRDEPELLARCYRRSLDLARDQGLLSIAFPSISTGAYGYPLEEAAVVAQSTVRRFLEEEALPEQVVFCCFSDTDREVYERVADRFLDS